MEPGSGPGVTASYQDPPATIARLYDVSWTPPHDRKRFEGQMSDLRRAVTVWKSVPSVDGTKLAFVGHKYGDWLWWFNRDPEVPKDYPGVIGTLSPT